MTAGYFAHGTKPYPAGGEVTAFTLTQAESGYAAGDVIIFNPTTTTEGLSSGLTPPSGAVALYTLSSVASGGVSGALYWYEVPETPPTSLTFTWSVARRGDLAWLILRPGAGGSLVNNAFGATAWISTSSATHTAPSITTTLANCFILGGTSYGSGGAVTAMPAGWTARVDATQREGTIATKGVQATAGATGTAVFDSSASGSYRSRSWQLAIAEVGGATLPTVTKPILGAAYSDGFTIHAKTTDATTARLKVGSNETVTADVVYSSADTPDADGYVSLTISGLPDRERDYYAIEATGPEGTITTDLLGAPQRVPAEGVPASFSIAFGSCWDPTSPGLPSFGRIRDREPLLFFHLGDWDYDDEESTSQAVHRDNMVAQLSDPGLAELVANVPVDYTKSDHDGDASEQGPGPWTAPNRAATLQLFPYYERPDPNGLYHSIVIGRVLFIVMDTRYLGDNSTTRLGATQKAWIKAQFERPEPFKVLVQDGVWICNLAAGTPGSDDSWPTYPAERTELGQHWTDHGVGTLLGMGGDQHGLGADDGSHNPWGGFPTVSAAPFRNGSSIKVASDSDWSHGDYPTIAQTDTNVAQFGWIDFVDDGNLITATFTGYDTTDTARVTMTVGSEGYVPPEIIAASSTASLTGPADRWMKSAMRTLWYDASLAKWRAIIPTSTGHRLITFGEPGETPVLGAVVDARQTARITAWHNEGTTYVLAVAPGTDGGVLRRFDSAWAQIGSSSTYTFTGLADMDAQPVTMFRSTNGDLWFGWFGSNALRTMRSEDDGVTLGAAGQSNALTVGGTTGVVGISQQAGTDTIVVLGVGNDGSGRWVRTINQTASSLTSLNWTTEALPALPSGLTSDDHLSMLGLPDGRIIAASKTTGSVDDTQTLLYSLIRATSGTWTMQHIEAGPDDVGWTRPILVCDGDQFTVFYGNYQEPFSLVKRTTPMDTLGTWSGRAAVLTDGDFSDSATAPGPGCITAAGQRPWPVLAHDRATDKIVVAWQGVSSGDVGPIPGTVGTDPVSALYIGAEPVVGMFLGAERIWGVAPEIPEGLAAKWTFDMGTSDLVSARTLSLDGGAALVSARGGQALAASAVLGTATSGDGFLDVDGFSIAFLLYTPDTAVTTRVAFLAGATTVAELYSGWRNLAGTIYTLSRVMVETGTGAYNRVSQVSTGGSSIPAQAWRHVVGTYDGANLKLYVDGAEVSTGAKTGTVTIPDGFTIDVQPGSIVDDVSIWSRALTPVEVAAMHAAG